MLTVLGVSGTAVSLAQNPIKTEAAALQSTQSQTQLQTREQSVPTKLISPTSYEQYLTLSAPSDVAVTNDYVAIADGNAIYVYDKKEGVYRKYVHNFNKSDPLKNNITKLQFDGNDQLYFLDATYLYVLDPSTLKNETPTVKETKFPCSTFLLSGSVLYYTDVKTEAQLSKIDLGNSEIDVSQAVTLESGLTSKPTITYFNHELYYTDGGKHLYKINPETKKSSFIAAFESEIVSMHIYENVFTCSDIGGNFYAYSLPELSTTHDANATAPLAHYEGKYASLALFGNSVYAVNGSSVCEYSLANSAFTDYEICNASASKHRTNGAAELFLSGDTLFIADNGNSRISVYDRSQGEFLSPIPCTLSPTYLVSDGETLLAANETDAILYDLSAEDYGAQIDRFNGFNGKLVGAASVYGSYYFATENNYFYALRETQTTNENGETQTQWQNTETKKTSTRYAKLLTADAYGYLYVASGSSVYRFTESEFISKVSEGTEAASGLPAQTEKILVDYAGELYALASDKLQKVGADEPYALNEPLVYSQTANVQSFAFGIVENETYVLYEENYLAVSSLLELPTVKNIPVNGSDQGIFSLTPTAVEIVHTKPDSMLVEFDLAKLSGASEFPYLAYDRSEAGLTALKLGETADQKHAILAIYNAETKTYKACLALTSACTPLTDAEKSEYYKTYETAQTAYVTNDVFLYKFPHLSGLPTFATIARNTQIKLLGEVNHLDYSYYLVSYTNADGATLTGYIPKAFAISFDPTPPQAEEVIYGPKTWDSDAIWRLAYLILGAGAICILLDVLILRKQNKE